MSGDSTGWVYQLRPEAQRGGEQDGRLGRAFWAEKASAWTRGRKEAGCLLELELGSSLGPMGHIPTLAPPAV